MRRAHLALSGMTLIAAAGCSRPEPSSVGDRPTVPPGGAVVPGPASSDAAGASNAPNASNASDAPPEPPASQAPPTSAGAAGCGAIADRFLATLRAASGACTSAGECGCYNPVHASLGCGGVTDRATSGRLAEIQRDFLGAGCDWPHQCAAEVCAPRCDAGRCR